MLLQLQDLYKEDLNNIDLDELDQIDPEVDQDLEVDPENLNNEVVCLFCLFNVLFSEPHLSPP